MERRDSEVLAIVAHTLEKVEKRELELDAAINWRILHKKRSIKLNTTETKDLTCLIFAERFDTCNSKKTQSSKNQDKSRGQCRSDVCEDYIIGSAMSAVLKNEALSWKYGNANAKKNQYEKYFHQFWLVMI